MVRIKSILNLLTVSIALTGYLPLQAYLDPFARWFFPAALALGLFLHLRGSFLSGRILTPLSIILFLYLGAGFDRNNMIVVTADLLVVFLGIRMLGEGSGRNYLQVFALSLFCLAASSLYSLSALFLVYLLLLLVLLAVSLVVLTFHSQDAGIALTRPQLNRVLTVASLMPVASVPLLLFLFAILPRTQYPLWDFMNQGQAKATGFSDTVKPGGSASVAEVKNVVFRAITPKLPDGKLYWRGIVLNGFRDNAWVRLPLPAERMLRPEKGESVQQEIYPEPTRNQYLLALNIPEVVSGVRYATANDAVFQAQRPLEKRIKYQVQSTLSEALQVKGGIERDFYLKLPETLSARMRAQGGALARQGGSVEEKVRVLERFFRSQKIAYATTGLPVGADPLDAFLYEGKRGNCEFFASSAATLFRVAGVPARLVGGYRGGNYNDMGGYYLVTEDMAHVWVEVFAEGRGWLTVDPTAWSVGFTRGSGAGKTLRMYVDALGFYWNKAVVTYDLEKQLALVSAAGSKARNLRFPAASARRLALPALALVAGAGLVFLYLKRPRTREERVLRRFLDVVRRRYPWACQEPFGLFELAQKVDDPGLREFVAIYGQAFYRDRRLQVGELARLEELIRTVAQHRS